MRTFTVWHNTLLADTGLCLVHVHDADTCHPPCTVHHPTEHHMRGWELIWRGDRKLFERICPHGQGHPDPDQFGWWAHTGQEHMAWHGCDGCCREET